MEPGEMGIRIMELEQSSNRLKKWIAGCVPYAQNEFLIASEQRKFLEGILSLTELTSALLSNEKKRLEQTGSK